MLQCYIELSNFVMIPSKLLLIVKNLVDCFLNHHTNKQTIEFHIFDVSYYTIMIQPRPPDACLGLGFGPLNGWGIRHVGNLLPAPHKNLNGPNYSLQPTCSSHFPTHLFFKTTTTTFFSLTQISMDTKTLAPHIITKQQQKKNNN